MNSENDIRINKIKELLKNKISSWPSFEEITMKAKDAKLLSSEEYNNLYKFSGRLIGKREHGKTIFLTFQDDTGQIQAYIKNEENLFQIFNLITNYIDLGDYIFISGSLFLTKTNELTIRIQDLKLLSKCLHPIPDEHVGFNDIEMRYRQRTIDLLVNKHVKEVFIKRSLIIQEIRNFLNDMNYLEVETPMLHSIPGGALAKPFITHHNALDMDLYLRIAPELYLKRLVVGGLEKVYEINRCFRNEGISYRHNPEFTTIECYTANHDYVWCMNLIESMIKKILLKINNNLKIQFGDFLIDFEKSFDRISAYDAILKYTDLKKEDLIVNNINKILLKYNLKIENLSYNQKIFVLFEEIAEKKLINPTFLIDFPIEISPLSKCDKDNSLIASRFELFIAGMEIANGFNELNDPFEQAERFREQVKNREKGDEEAMYFDQDFITALEYGLPPTVGWGLGIDRLIMLVANQKSIKDVILFPTMKRVIE